MASVAERAGGSPQLVWLRGLAVAAVMPAALTGTASARAEAGTGASRFGARSNTGTGTAWTAAPTSVDSAMLQLGVSAGMLGQF